MSKMSAEQAAGYYFGADALNYYAGGKGQHCPLFGRLSNVIFGKNSEIDSGQQQDQGFDILPSIYGGKDVN